MRLEVLICDACSKEITRSLDVVLPVDGVMMSISVYNRDGKDLFKSRVDFCNKKCCANYLNNIVLKVVQEI